MCSACALGGILLTRFLAFHDIFIQIDYYPDLYDALMFCRGDLTSQNT